MAEWSKALRSGRSPLLWAWVRIPLLTTCHFVIYLSDNLPYSNGSTFIPILLIAEWRSGSVLGP